MEESTVVPLKAGTETSRDALTEIIRQGACRLLAEALEAEVAGFVAQFQAAREDGSARLVRNGYLPEREVQTGIGGVGVRVPRVRDRAPDEDGPLCFTSKLVPPYLRKTRSVEELIPWLYLRGVSTGGFSDALDALLGPGAPGLSASTVSRLKAHWEAEHEAWRDRSLAGKRYVYLWADGIHCTPRMDDAKLCILVLIGTTEDGRKELVAVEEGYRESEQSWLELLRRLRSKGLSLDPRLAVGDGGLGFWKALRKVFGNTRQQRCWVHKTANVLNKMPKAVQPKAKQALHEIWMAQTREDAHKAFDLFLETYRAKYPKAVACLEKDRTELLAFYDFPAEHWVHLRTTNPVESTFGTVRLRTAKTRNCLNRRTMLAMVFKLCQAAQANWRRLQGYKLIADVLRDVRFIDGVREDRIAA